MVMILTGLLVVCLAIGTHGELHGVRLRHDNFNCYDHKPKINNGYYEVLRGDAHVVRAHCNAGFQLIGAGLRLCQPHEKRFTGNEPRCEDIDECELLANVTGNDEGSAEGLDDDSSDEPEPCHYKARCINTPGSYRCECQDGLKGSGFHCKEPETCTPLETPEHAHVLQRSQNIIRFYCHPDYSIHGNETLICTDGQWSSEPPECVPGWKTCADPGVPEDGYRLGNRFYLGSVARFWCRDGFDLVGPKFIICLDDTEKWTSSIPECVASKPQITDEPAQAQMEFQTGQEIRTPLESENTDNLNVQNSETEDAGKLPKPFEVDSVKKDNSAGLEVAGEIILEDHRETQTPKVQYDWLGEVHSSGAVPETLCLGAFICSDWLLVPARCLQQYQDNFIKLMEPGDLMVYTAEEHLKVLKIYRHPRYFMGHHGHDVAVMKVEKRLVGQQQETVEIPDGKSPTPSLVELWSRDTGTLEKVTVLDHHQCPQDGPYRLSSDTVCVQTKVSLGSPLVARWKFPDEPERQFLLAVAKEYDGVLFTDVRKHHRWIISATEGCSL